MVSLPISSRGENFWPPKYSSKQSIQASAPIKTRSPRKISFEFQQRILDCTTQSFPIAPKLPRTRKVYSLCFFSINHFWNLKKSNSFTPRRHLNVFILSGKAVQHDSSGCQLKNTEVLQEKPLFIIYHKPDS